MARMSIGVAFGLVIVFFLGLIVIGNASQQGAGGSPIDFTSLPDPVERFDGEMLTTSHSMMVPYDHALFIPVIEGSPGIAKILKYVPGPNGTKGVLSEFLVGPSTGGRYDYLGVHGGLLYIAHTNGSVFKCDGTEMTLLTDTPFTQYDWVTCIEEFKGKMYFGTDGGYIYREANGLYNVVYLSQTKIYGMGIWNDTIFATSAGNNPVPNWMTSIIFSDTGNENEWTVDWINGQIEYLCGSTNDFVTLYDHQTDPGGDRVLRTRDIPHFSIVNQSDDEYKQHHDSFLFDDIEYIFTNSEWNGLSHLGRLVMVEGYDTTTIITLPKLIIACEVMDNYVYVVAPALSGAQKSLHAVALDHEAPVVTSDSTPSIVRTGGVLAFEAAVIDNFDVGSFFAEHWTDSSPAHVKASMGLRSGTTHEGVWALTLPVALDSVETIHYAFVVTDTTSNVLVTPTKDVEVRDDRPPTFLGDHSDTSGTAGHPFGFSTDVTDNIGIAEVHVEYWYGTGARTNLTLTGTGTYTKTADLPSSSAGQMSYIFTARDAAGNWNATLARNAIITDVDPPSFAEHTPPTEGTTGDPVLLSLGWIHDNVGVGSAHLEFWLGDGGHTNITLSGHDPYTIKINTSANATSLTYFFSAVDTSGNWASTPTWTVPIRDNDPPQLGGDGSDAYAGVGKQFAFRVDASDNLGLEAVKVEHWFGQGAHQNQSMAGGPPTFALEIGIGATETELLSYFFYAEDESGNVVVSRTFTRTPGDHMRPTFGSDGSDGTAIAGKDFKLVASWSDDVGVATAFVEYWFDGGTHENVSMALADGKYAHTIAIPDDAKGRLHYQFNAKDAAGNWASSSELGLDVTPAGKPAGEKSELLLWAVVAIVIIVVVVALLLVMMRGRRGRAPATAPTAPMGTEAVQAGGAVGGAAVAGPPIGAPPLAPMAPVAPPPTAPAAAPGKFMVINIKTQCTACGGMIERGTNAYVCSCGIALHEQCAGRLMMCPSCKNRINFG